MSLHSVFWALIFSLSLAGCKTTNVTATLAGDNERSGANCACDDLKCWQERTTSAQADAFSAATSAVKSAIEISDGGLAAQAAIVGLGVVEVAQAIHDPIMSEIIENFSSESKQSILKFFPEDLRETPFVGCIEGMSTLFVGVSGVFNSIRNYKQEGADGLTSVASSWLAASSVAKGFTTGLTQCLATAGALQQNDSLRSFMLLAEGWERITDNIGGVIAIVAGGMKIYSSGKVLIGNTMCLIADVQKAAGTSVVLSPRDPIPQRIRGSKGTCNGDPLTCASGVMDRYGRFLYKNSEYYFFTQSRAKYCVNKCNNGADARHTCETALRANGFATMPGCENFCAVAQDINCVQQCVGTCCNLDGDCTGIASDILRGSGR